MPFFFFPTLFSVFCLLFSSFSHVSVFSSVVLRMYLASSSFLVSLHPLFCAFSSSMSFCAVSSPRFLLQIFASLFVPLFLPLLPSFFVFLCRSLCNSGNGFSASPPYDLCVCPCLHVPLFFSVFHRCRSSINVASVVCLCTALSAGSVSVSVFIFFSVVVYVRRCPVPVHPSYVVLSSLPVSLSLSPAPMPASPSFQQLWLSV